MKKIIIVLAVFAVLGFLWHGDSVYEREVKIIDSCNGLVTCSDRSGNIWQYEGDAVIGKKIIVIMEDNHTSKITDDKIIKVKNN